MIILVDLDGTVVDWGKAWDAEVEDHRFFGRGRGIKKHLEQDSFDLKAGLTSAAANIVDVIMNSIDYLEMEALPGAIDALKEMKEEGHHVRLVSTPTITNPNCAQDKYDWVWHNFGELWAQNLILTHDKTLITGDYLIDDKPKIKGLLGPRASWRQVYYTQPYNKDESGLRISDWSEWKKVLY